MVRSWGDEIYGVLWRVASPAELLPCGEDEPHPPFATIRFCSPLSPWRYRLGVRTEDSQSSNPGSIPGSATNQDTLKPVKSKGFSFA